MFLLSAIIVIGIAMALLAAVLDKKEQNRIEESIRLALREEKESTNEVRRAINPHAYLSE